MTSEIKTWPADIQMALKDPSTVYLAMLRGSIATPSIDNLVHLCNDRLALLEALKRQNPELFTPTAEELADIERRIKDAAIDPASYSNDLTAKDIQQIEDWHAAMTQSLPVGADCHMDPVLQPEQRTPTEIATAVAQYLADHQVFISGNLLITAVEVAWSDRLDAKFRLTPTQSDPINS